MFFFQAEDGIRDLVRSRGLGDVYKRQKQYGLKENDIISSINGKKLLKTEDLVNELESYNSVSYTHLTLPTSDLV